MIRCLLQARRALDPSQRQSRQQQNNAPTPLRRQRLPKGLGRGAAHDAIQASARLREAPCSPESATRGILSTYKRHLLWDIEEAFRNLKGDLAIRPIFHHDESRIEAYIFIAFLAYALQVTLTRRLHALAPGLTAQRAGKVCRRPDDRRPSADDRRTRDRAHPLHPTRARAATADQPTQAHSALAAAAQNHRRGSGPNHSP